MADRLFKTPLRALDAAGDGVSGAKVYLYETGTSTPVTAYTDSGAGTAHPTPLVADGGGTFAQIFVSGSAGVKVDVTDSAGASLDGYPVDPVLPESASNTGASNVSFAPTTEIPETDVQAAIEAAALLLGVSSNDTTPAYLEDKLLVSGDGLSLSTQNDGGDETRTITSAAATETTKGTVEKATTAEAEAGTEADKFPDVVGVAAAIAALNPFGNALLHVRDEKSSGTNGGTSSSGFNTRVLNTVATNEITGASLSSNQITLPAGTYHMIASAPGMKQEEAQLTLYNTTDTAYELVGTSVRDGATNGDVTLALVSGRFTLAAEKVLELRHYISSGRADGLGRDASSGQVEVYADVQIWKVA